MKTISGVSVGNYTYSMARTALTEGRRVFVAVPEGDGECANCGGGGIIVLTTTSQYPTKSLVGNITCIDDQWFGGVENTSYPCPICMETPDMSVLFQDSGLSMDESYWELAYIEGMAGKENALTEARNLLSGTPRPTGLYTFFGDYGTGKTGILKSVTSAFIKAYVKARYVRANDFLTEVKASFTDDSISEESIIATYSRYQFLAIDEVDRISNTEWARATTFTLLDQRYNARNFTATAMATNKFPDKMGGDWGYLMSRMLDGVRVPVGGETLRGVT